MAITGEVIQANFQIRTTSGFGSSFVITVDSRQYLVTAAHLLSEAEIGIPAGNPISVDIYHDSLWKPLQCKMVGVGSGERDIAVLALPQSLLKSDCVKNGSKGLLYGQDVYFLGFPHLLRGDGKINNDYPIPYVKRAIVSVINPQLIVLDGHNNPGFSGGPVIFKSADEPGGNWHIAGVISARSTVRIPVYVGSSDVEASFTVEEDTGLIDCCPLEVGLDLIKKCPIGHLEPG